MFMECVENPVRMLLATDVGQHRALTDHFFIHLHDGLGLEDVHGISSEIVFAQCHVPVRSAVLDLGRESAGCWARLVVADCGTR
jgi:hypothetical protein